MLRTLSSISPIVSCCSERVVCRTYYLKQKKPVFNLERIKSVCVNFGGLTEGAVGTREFASQISGKRVKASNPKAQVSIHIDNMLAKPNVTIVYDNNVTKVYDTTNLQFKKILHVIEDDKRLVEMEMDKKVYDAFRKQVQDYILNGIKEVEEKHKEMIKKMQG